MDTETPCKYNWDDLDVGKIDVNHSEKFFRFKHFKHEKFNENISTRKELYNSGTNEKENESNILNHNQLKGENLTKVHFQQPAEQQKQQIKEEKRSQNNTETVKTEEENDDDNGINKNNVEIETKNEQSTNTVANDDNDNNPRRIAHIITERRTLRKILNVKDDKIPNVYRYNEIYEKKRQEMINRIEEENRKQRIFHSKPAPKFNNKSNDCKTANNKQTEIKATVPITPLVLKKSKEFEEKRKKKIEEYEKRMRPRAFTCREPIVLREEPYKPKKQDHAVELKPFNLHVQKRLEERKVFDEKFKKALEEKKKQVSKEEEEKLRREKELVKELRKLTTFKARPNPFKN